jgi:hypothetical protein
MTTTPHLFERIMWASQNLKPVQPDYCVLYEDPEEPDAPVKIMIAAPEWLAMALHGGLLPPIEAYLLDAQEPDDAPKRHPYAEPIGPMTQEEAMEYLVMKDVPRRVWDRPGSNRRLFAIVPRSAIPADQTHRDAWRLNDLVRAAA